MFLITLSLFIIMFLFVALCPVCRHCESSWIYVLTLLASLPLNLHLLFHICDFFLYRRNLFHNILGLLLMFILFSVLLSIEEIVTGIIGRIIWKRQQVIVHTAEKFKIEQEDIIQI